MSEGELSVLPRGLQLIAALLAAVGGAAIYMLALPALWRMSWPYGILFLTLGILQAGTVVALLARPTPRRALSAAAAALVVFVLWALARLARALPSPDPWIPVNSVIGFTDYICAGLELLATASLTAMAAMRPRPGRTAAGRVLTALAITPLMIIILLATVLGIFASSDGFAGAGFPAGTVPPRDLPAGEMSTVEYCRPDRVPLAMDLYMPPANVSRGPAPVALYVHGGGIWGDRKLYGLGAKQANHHGALFVPLQEELNERGFVVASIDYRLPPGTPWPASLEDAKCAVRFLRAHASDLDIDPERIGVWGSSGGGHLVSLLGLAGGEAGFDRGQYVDQSSTVQAVVDMFGAADLNDFERADPFAQFILRSTFGSSPDVRRAASPIIYVTPGDPPFLILHGTEDPMIPPRQSESLAASLEIAGVPVTLIKVQGAGHDLTTPGQHPSPEELVTTIVEFFEKTLR